jgi:hypothetical protein
MQFTTSQGLSYQKKADGGYDYFVNGQPASLEDFTLAGGVPPTDEPAIRIQANEIGNETGGGTGGGTGETGGGTEEEIFTPHYVNGVRYDDLISYTNAVTQASLDEYNRQNKLLTDAYNQGILDFATYQDQITQAREAIKKNYTDAMSSISGRFSALSPEAYQSSQGTAEGQAKDITEQNYANVAGQEANLGMQRSLYDTDYANKLESNRLAHQAQVDENLNQVYANITGTPYASRMNEINKPILNNLTPMDNTVMGAYSNLSQLSKEGNIAGIQNTIKNLNVEDNIKQWLYDRFAANNYVNQTS